MTADYGPAHWHCQIGFVKRRENIYTFPGTVAPELPISKQPNDAVILYLQNLLERAKTGELQAVGIAQALYDGTTRTSWRGGDQWACSLLGGALFLLAVDYAVQHNDEARKQQT